MKQFGVLLVLLVTLSLTAQAEDIQPVFKVGDAVPTFKLPYATQDTIAFEGYGSADLAGKTYIIAFYPADWSGGCTKEVCNFRDKFDQFEALKVELLPISTDLVFSHHEWAKHHKLQFKLLADHTRDFGKQMGVYLPDYGMFQRSVFVVGPDGKFRYVDYEYSLEDESDFEALQAGLSE